MKIQKLLAYPYQQVRFLPPVLVDDAAGNRIPIDRNWVKTKALFKTKALNLFNTVTHFNLEDFDVHHVKSFDPDPSGRSDGFLILKSQIVIHEDGVECEPIL